MIHIRYVIHICVYNNICMIISGLAASAMVLGRSQTFEKAASVPQARIPFGGSPAKLGAASWRVGVATARGLACGPASRPGKLRLAVLTEVSGQMREKRPVQCRIPHPCYANVTDFQTSEALDQQFPLACLIRVCWCCYLLPNLDSECLDVRMFNTWTGHTGWALVFVCAA